MHRAPARVGASTLIVRANLGSRHTSPPSHHQRAAAFLLGGWAPAVPTRGLEPQGQFSRTTQFRTQSHNRGKVLVGAHDPCLGHRLQLFSPSLDIVSPLFVLQLAQGIVDVVLFDNVTVRL